MEQDEVDTSFDVRIDTPAGRDPDAGSPTLRRFHRLLWDKPLPSGPRFTLVTTEPGSYLHHRSDLGKFWMTSDAVVHSYRSWTRFGLPAIVGEILHHELEAFDRASSTIGAMMLFPSWTGVRHWSINQARGMLTTIADQMDLTLECIRRHDADGSSPMSNTLAWYADSFALFSDFRGFVHFFLLDDPVTTGGDGVRFFVPLDDFRRAHATPATAREYRAYMAASMEFVAARNARIDGWSAGRPHPVDPGA